MQNTLSQQYKILSILTKLPIENRKRVALVVCLALLLPLAALAAQNDNLRMLRLCADSVADSLLMACPPKTPICVRVIDHSGAWLVEQGMLTSAEKRAITVAECASPGTQEMLIAITSLGIEYTEIDGSNYLLRSTRLGVSASLPNWAVGAGKATGKITRSLEVLLLDTISSSRTFELDNSGYSFTKGTFIAKSQPGFWEKVVEPAVVLAASIVTVILLFTVRSQ